jgi:hypothetical protein
MDFLSRRRGRKLGALAVAAGLAVAVLVAAVVVLRQPVPVTARAVRIAVTDGLGGSQHVSLDATFFTPPTARACCRAGSAGWSRPGRYRGTPSSPSSGSPA